MALLRDHPLLHRYLHTRFASFKATGFEIRMAWADEIELIGVIEVDNNQYFLGAEALGSHRAKPGDYRGLSADECSAIRFYRGFRLLQPWPQPTLTIALGPADDGHVIGAHQSVVPVQMREIGSSQAWWGDAAGVVWEVLLNRDVFPDPDLYRICYMAFWRNVEDHLRGQGVRAFVTEHVDPNFDITWYQDVLRSLGYSQIQGGAFRKELS